MQNGINLLKKKVVMIFWNVISMPIVNTFVRVYEKIIVKYNTKRQDYYKI